MNRRRKLAVALATLAILTLSACGSGGEDATASAGSTPSSAAASLSETNKRIMERYTGVFLPSGDPKMAEEFVSPDIVVHFSGQELRGRETYLDIIAANAVAFPDLKWTVEGMVADGDTVAVRYKMTGTHRGPFAGVPGTGKAIVSQSMTFYRLVDGKIVEERALLDMLSILQQMGTVPRT